jgi:hypothetical protein
MTRTSPRRAAGGARAPKSPRASAVPARFLDAWGQLVSGWDLPPLPTRRGRKPRVPVTDLLAGLTFHMLSGAGTLALLADLMSRAAAARRTRVEANRSAACERCPSVDAAA